MDYSSSFDSSTKVSTAKRRKSKVPKCIDVERRFRGYLVAYEDPVFVATQDPWHKVIKCRQGHICPAGGNKLWACTKTRTCKAAKAFLSGDLPCEIKMDGDDGLNVEFDVSDYKLFFKTMEAMRK